MKNNKGITLIALVVTIVILLILAGISIQMLSGNNGILTRAKEAKEQMEEAQDLELLQMEILESSLDEGTPSIGLLIPKLEEMGCTVSGESYPLSVSYNGKNYKIDEDGKVKIDDGSSDEYWDEDKGVNKPKLASGLIPVTFNNDGSITELSENDYSNWYDYSNKKWANAITKDQNENITGYWVWIPRYEYIVNSSTQSFTVKFIPVEQTVEDSGYDHIHPSFRDGSQTHYMNGEWDSELPGFWVAKFPAGFQKNTITDSNGTLSIDISNSEDQSVFSDKKYTFIYTWGDLITRMGTINTETNMSLPVFNPLTYAYSDICAGDSYTLAKEVSKNSDFYGLNQNSDSHLLKNSEWGAVTYLAQSQYGRNGTEISINNFYIESESNEDQYYGITGMYADGSEEWMSDTLGNAWYTEIGQGGSSTGNITGIYDLNGCVGERTASYISNESYNLDLNKGISNWINTTANVNGYQTLSSKYYTVYPYDSNNDTDTGNWNKYNSLKSATYGYGDAILETSTNGTGQNSWFEAHSVYFEADFPFMERGGASASGLYAGGFCYEEGPGIGNPSVGFRVVLCP